MIVQKTPVRLAALCALCFLLAGFGALLAFWLSNDWPTDNGLFNYRSATIGDGLLLPLMAGILVAGIAATSPTSHDRRNGYIGLAVGLLAGAATQATWLADDSPNFNWTLPAPHEFNAPGWYHAVFLSLACGALLGLGAKAATRVRAAREIDDQSCVDLASSPWLGVLFGASLTMAGLLIADNGQAAETQAGAATSVGLAFAAAVSLGLLWWTFGRSLRHARRNLTISLAAAFGATAIATWGLAAPVGVAAATSASAVIVGFALSDIRPDRRPSMGKAIAITLALLGGAAVAFQIGDGRGPEAAIAIACSSAVAVWIGNLRPWRTKDSALVGVAIFYVFGLFALAAWLAARPADTDEAAIAVGASLTVLDALVIALIRDRFRAFMDEAQTQRRAGGKASPPGTHGDATGTWALIVGLGFPALLALGVLFVVAAPGLGVDEVAGGRPPGLTAWLAADVAVLVLIAAMVGVALRRRPEVGEFDVDTQPTISLLAATGCLLGAAMIVAVASTQLHGPLHYPLAAGIAALAAGVLVTEDLQCSSLRLQLARVVPLAWALAVAAGAMVAVGVFWLLTVGLWDGSRPASAAGALMACGVTLIPLGLSAGGIGIVISAALRTPHLTEQPPAANVFWQQLMYAALVLIVIAIPFFVVGRLDAQADLANSGLLTLASLGFMPALVGAVLWVLKMNADHDRSEKGNLWPICCTKMAADAPPATELNQLRKERLHSHVVFVNRLVGGMLAGGLLWIAANAL